MRLLNVRNPAAIALVTDGGKDIENRSYPFPFQRPGQPEWVGVVASGNRVTEVERNYIATRMQQSGLRIRDILRFWAHDHPGQALVGAIEIIGNTTTSESVWYNGGQDFGWVVGRRVRLEHPIEHVDGTQCLRYLHTYPDRRKRRAMMRSLCSVGCLSPVVARRRRRIVVHSDDDADE